MPGYDYDLFVIGAGSGGIRAARMAADLGVKVAIAEQSRTGGTCVNLGCVPKKLYVHATEYGAAFNNARGFGWESQPPQFNWSTLRENKTSLISRSNNAMENMLARAGAELIRGRAQLTGPHSVKVGERNITAERILLTPGSRPVKPDIPGNEFMLTSDQIFDLEQLPERILIIGGGYIATEFAGIFNGLGVSVTQAYRGELFLRGFDIEVREFIASHMRRKGIDLRFKCEIENISKNTRGSFTAQLRDGTKLDAELILSATGRFPNIEGLGLETTAVTFTESGSIAVNEFYQTSAPSIYALGDVIDGMQLTPIALAEAMILVKHLYQGGTERLSYDLIPTAVFSQPNFSSVGMTEEEAMEQSPCLDVYTTEFRSLKHGLTGSGERIFMKLLVDRSSDRVLGAHMAGEGSAETIQAIAVALKAGATKTDFDQTLGIHPTSAEEFVTMRTLTRNHQH